MIETAAPPAPATAERAAVWEDFIDIFFTPSQVFARRALAGPWVPLAVLTVVMGVLFYLSAALLEPMMSAEFYRGMAGAMRNNPNMTPEAVATARSITLRVGQFGGLFMPIGVLLTGTLVWLIGKFFDAKQTFKAALMVTAYAFLPRIIETGVTIFQGLLIDPARLDGRLRLTLGVGRFFDPDFSAPMLLALIGRIDLFTIWVTVLLALGLSVTGGIPRARALMAAPLIWMIGAIPLVLQAMGS
jgi:hypothetical protein